jgi:pimeloyl-ACP methyl ester carboxylesterase
MLTVDQLVDDLEQLRVHLEIERPVLLGHSFGCRILAEYAKRFPGIAQGLVLLTPPPVGESSVVAQARADVLAMRESEPELADAIEAARALPTAHPRDRSSLEAMTVPLWYARWDAETQAHAARASDETPARTAHTLRQSAQAKPPPDFSKISTPALLVAGQLDYLTPPVGVHAIHDDLQHSTYAEIEGASHYPWLDEPELLRAVTGEFLDALEIGA